MKKILITGADSYIGTSVETWLNRYPQDYWVDTLDMKDPQWKTKDFSPYDVVFHVAGIAHADTGKVSEERKKFYYRVNRDLAVETAGKAKREGVKQFIFMSSMIVYSGCRESVITGDTVPKPLNFYGDSKWQADQAVRQMQSDDFRVVVLRPPMIYGKGSKGNYPTLAKMAKKLPVFPKVKNKRSMLYIGNLCEFVRLMIDNEEVGVFFPQNGEYVNTSDMVKRIAEATGHRIWVTGLLMPFVEVGKHVPGKIGQLCQKAFGSSCYEMGMSAYRMPYVLFDLGQSVGETEK